MSLLGTFRADQQITALMEAIELYEGNVPEETLGRSPLFLLGDDTGQPAVDEIRAVAEGKADMGMVLSTEGGKLRLVGGAFDVLSRTTAAAAGGCTRETRRTMPSWAGLPKG